MTSQTIERGDATGATVTPDGIDRDLIDRLAGFADGSPLLALRATRADARARAQAAHDALLFPQRPGRLPAVERATLAARLAELSGDAGLAAHYRVLAGDGGDARPALVAHVERVALFPRDSRPEHVRALEAAGLDAHAIVALSQLIALVSFQARVLAGLRALDGRGGEGVEPFVGVPVPADPAFAFTTDTLEWRPWLTPVVLDEASEEQRRALAVTPSNTAIGAYSLVLAHEPESLLHRTPLFNGILYAPRGLPRSDREFASAVESVLNGCVYCASVHTRRFVELTGERGPVEALFAQGIAGLSDQPRLSANARAAARLTTTPAALANDDVAALRSAGLSDGDIHDVILSVAIFAWANRLMLSLGEAVR